MRKYLGIPLAAWLIVATVATASAWYCFATISSTTTVQGPLSTANEDEFEETMQPGENNTWTWDIVNADTTQDYFIKADLTYSAPSGVTITKFTVTRTGTTTDKTEDLTGDNSAQFWISAGGKISCSLTITAAKDAAPGDVTYTLDLSRETPEWVIM